MSQPARLSASVVETRALGFASALILLAFGAVASVLTNQVWFFIAGTLFGLTAIYVAWIVSTVRRREILTLSNRYSLPWRDQWLYRERWKNAWYLLVLLIALAAVLRLVLQDGRLVDVVQHVRVDPTNLSLWLLALTGAFALTIAFGFLYRELQFRAPGSEALSGAISWAQRYPLRSLLASTVITGLSLWVYYGRQLPLLAAIAPDRFGPVLLQHQGFTPTPWLAAGAGIVLLLAANWVMSAEEEGDRADRLRASAWAITVLILISALRLMLGQDSGPFIGGLVLFSLVVIFVAGLLTPAPYEQVTETEHPESWVMLLGQAIMNLPIVAFTLVATAAQSLLRRVLAWRLFRVIRASVRWAVAWLTASSWALLRLTRIPLDIPPQDRGAELTELGRVYASERQRARIRFRLSTQAQPPSARPAAAVRDSMARQMRERGGNAR